MKQVTGDRSKKVSESSSGLYFTRNGETWLGPTYIHKANLGPCSNISEVWLIDLDWYIWVSLEIIAWHKRSGCSASVVI